MNEDATLSVDGKTYVLPVIEGTEGERAIDIRRLRAQTGLITLDDGFGNTGSCESAITFIDGERGTLLSQGVERRLCGQSAERTVFGRWQAARVAFAEHCRLLATVTCSRATEAGNVIRASCM